MACVSLYFQLLILDPFRCLPMLALRLLFTYYFIYHGWTGVYKFAQCSAAFWVGNYFRRKDTLFPP